MELPAFMQAGVADFMANPWLYLSMPFISGLVGYGTNVLAIKMMFHPLEFFGFMKPYFGWQGIVPSKAGKMAAISVDTITDKLITQEEMFSRIDPDRVADELEAPMLELVPQITNEVMSQHMPTLWSNTPAAVKRAMAERIRKESPRIIAEVMDEVRNNIANVFDLKEMVITALVRDKALLNRMFLETGAKEFRFIGHSGLYFGFAFGVIQMLIWIFYKGVWLLPVGGLLVGYATNWIALKMIFSPAKPKKFGPITFQGLFHKRQNEVAGDYGRLVSQQIVTPANILESILKGPYSDKMFGMIQRHVQQSVDEELGSAKQFVLLTVGTRSYEEIKHAAVEKTIAAAPSVLTHVTEYAEDAMDIQNTLVTRLQGLSPEDFEGMLRPAFEEDEWMLIAVGALLGLGVGFFQLFVMFGDILLETVAG